MKKCTIQSNNRSISEMVLEIDTMKKCSDYPSKLLYLLVLAGVAQWLKHQPVQQRIAGLIPNQGEV